MLLVTLSFFGTLLLSITRYLTKARLLGFQMAVIKSLPVLSHK